MAMSGTAYKALGFVAWKAGLWYLRKRLGMARRVGMGALGVAALVGGAVAVAKRRNGRSG
jgi:hypothetical protein